MDGQKMKASVPMLVPPAKPTPYEVIPLAGGSVLAGLNTMTYSHVLVFKPDLSRDLGSARPSAIVRSGLAQVLVPYYPLAGRIVQNENGWEVQCDGRGAVFIVTTVPDFEEWIEPQPPAHMEISVPPLHDSSPPPSSPSHRDQHYLDKSTSILPTLVVQVTEVEKGGFILSVKVYRGICDPMGMMHFLFGWAEMARGSPQVSVLPSWGAAKMLDDYFSSTTVVNDEHKSRMTRYQIHLPNLEKQAGDFFSGNQGIFSCHHDSRAFKANIMEKIEVEIPFELINRLVELIVQEDRPCTSAQALIAHVWRERTRALRIPGTAEARLFFESKAEKDHPLAFYGSFAFNCQAKTRAQDLLEKPLTYAVLLLQEAEANLVSDFTSCTNDFKQVHCSCGYVPTEVLMITSIPASDAEENLDFGVLGKPSMSSLDDISFPTNVNIAAVVPPSHAYESAVKMIMNNIPIMDVDNLRSCLSSIPYYKSSSRM